MQKISKILIALMMLFTCISIASSYVSANTFTLLKNDPNGGGGSGYPARPPGGGGGGGGGGVPRTPVKVKGTSGTFVLPPKIASTRTYNGKKQVERTYSSGKTQWINIKNGKLAGKKHPVTKVIFDKKGFPIFKSRATITLPDKYLKSTNSTQFRQSNLALYKKRNQYKFPPGTLKRLKEGKNPKGYTWNHHQDRGKMQLVDTKIHEKTGHTGGKSIWGTN